MAVLKKNQVCLFRFALAKFGGDAVAMTRIGFFVLIAFLACLSAREARAADVEVLPAGVRMTQARFGVISGLNQTWKNDGNLYDLGETRSVTFDAATLARVNDRAGALVRALDQFGRRDLGSTLTLGTLNVSTQPQISYFAPILAYGVNDRLTLGFGIPVVRYNNEITLSASASNLDFYRQQLGGASAALDGVLNIDLVTETQRVLAEKNYRPLTNRNETFVGDAQLAMLYRLPEAGSWALLHQLTLTLPTGPKDDANDLMALNAFGRTSLEASLIGARVLGAGWTYLPSVSVLVPIPDRTNRRVPKNEYDTLPDADREQELGRWTGPTVALGSDLRWEVFGRWSLKGGIEAASKSKDRYSGSGRTDLLEKNTESSVLRTKGGLTYSTVEDYKLKKARMPSRISLEVTDTVAGRNIERQLRTDLTAMLFF